jgi:succinoglycan biosynthesis transport protein ExoP
MAVMNRLLELFHNFTGRIDPSISSSGSGDDGSALVAPANRILSLRQTGTLVGNTENQDSRRFRVDGVHVCPTERLVLYRDPTSLTADRFRLLRIRLLELWTTGKLRSVVVTSAIPQDGKSTIALNLAVVLAEQKTQSVLLIDGDLHHPSLSEQLGLGPHVGLTECLQYGLDPFSATQQVEPFGWQFLSAGKRIVDDPTALLHSQKLADIIRMVSAHFDWTIIDSPPLLPLTDAISLAQVADGSLVVARAGRTPGKAVEDAIALLQRRRVIGLVLNSMDTLDDSYSAYYRR